jgi:hypothetical protein
MRREHLGDVGLRGGRRRAQDQLAPRTASADVVVTSAGVTRAGPGNPSPGSFAGGAMRGDRLLVAPPQPHLVAGQREIARRRERAVAAAEHCDAHQLL